METLLVTPIGIVSFAVIFFLALVALVKWKRRRILIEARLNRGLRQYSVRQQAEEPVNCLIVSSGAIVGAIVLQ